MSDHIAILSLEIKRARPNQQAAGRLQAGEHLTFCETPP